MRRVTLGRTGLNVNANGFGALPVQRVSVSEEGEPSLRQPLTTPPSAALTPPLAQGRLWVSVSEEGEHDQVRRAESSRPTGCGFGGRTPVFLLIYKKIFRLLHQNRQQTADFAL